MSTSRPIGLVALVFTEPLSDVLWRLDWPDLDHGGTRAERYDGCQVFQNAAYCPAVRDRVEGLP